MEGVHTAIIAVVALFAGTLISYVYMQDQVSGLRGEASHLGKRVITLEAQLASATEQARTAASEIAALKADLDDKMRLIESQQAKIIQLEAVSQNPPPSTPQ